MLRSSVLFLLVLALTACGPSRAAVEATQTAVIATSDALKTEAAATVAVRGTSTPDARPKDVKCAESGMGVRYHLSDKNVGTVSVTLENDTGGTEQFDVSSPYCRQLLKFASGDFVYISAQIIGGEGELTCRIWYKDSVLAEARAEGQYNIATCSGQVP